MRRWIAILCLIALLFTACTADSSYQNDDADPPKPTEPTAAPARPTVSAPTAGGVKVYMDSSGYTAYSPEKEQYTRLREEYLDRFRPGSYGLVLPYPVNPLFSSVEGGYSWRAGYKYGLFDQNGRILTDGLYLNVSPLSYYDAEAEKTAYTGLWLVSQLSDVTIRHESSEFGEWEYPEGRTLYGVIGMDGSFIIPCDNSYFTAQEDCLITATTHSFTVYDLKGNPLLTAEDLGLGGADWYDLDYSQGRLMVCAHVYGQDGSYFFYDLTGNLISGPYAHACGYRNGLACVTEDGNHYGYVDLDGNWVIPARYYNSYANFTNGRAIQQSSEGQWVVLDTKGNTLFSVAGENLSQCALGYHASEYSFYSGYRYRYYDFDGNLVFSDDDGVWYALDENTLVSTTYTGGDGGRMTIHRLDQPDKDIVLPGFVEIREDVAWVDGELIHGYRVDRANGSGQAVFYTKDFGEVYDAPAQIMGEDYYYAPPCMINDEVDGTLYYAVYEGSNCRLFREDGTYLLSVSAQATPRIIGGLVCTLDATAYTCRTMDGTVVFRRNLDSGD